MLLYTIIMSIIAIILIALYITRYRKLPTTIWKPSVAWTRALIYFAFCNIISTITGNLEYMLNQPIATPEQLTNPKWITFCVSCFVFIFIAYWILWAKMTLTFDRKYYIITGFIFGVMWGASIGQLLLSFYHLWNMISIPRWAIYLVSFICMGTWQYFIQDYFWDIYVSPEHDTLRSIKIKTLFSHIPNVAICLLFLVMFENYLIFVIAQTFALIASSIFQKFPAPWAKGKFHAPMTKPGILGFPHGAGYNEKSNSE